MRLAAALAALLVGNLLAAALSSEADAQTTTVRFQTPSMNIGCLYSAATDQPSYLRCDVLSGLKPAPTRRCELDWTGFTMTPNRRATATCAGDTVYSRTARMFPYAFTWRRGGFACTVRRVGLRCKNAIGDGFFLSRARSYTF